MEPWQTSGYLCSFCGKSQKETWFIIAGPAVYICDSCVGLCSEILKEEDARWRMNKRIWEIGLQLGTTFLGWEYD